MDTTQLPFQTKLSTITDALMRCGYKMNRCVHFDDFQGAKFFIRFSPILMEIKDKSGFIHIAQLNPLYFTTDQILLCLLSIGVLHHNDFDTMTSDLINKVKNG